MDDTRRRLLFVGGSLSTMGLSGCLRRAGGVVRGIRETFSDEGGTSSPEINPSDENEPVTGSADETDDYINTAYRNINTDLEIDPGSVYYWEFTHLDSTNDSNHTLEYDVIVRSGPNVNVIFMDLDELDLFLNYENIRYYEDKSILDSTHAVIETEIRSQAYAFVIENTSSIEQTTVNVDLVIR